MKIALGLGSSLGHRRGHLERTLWQLAAKPDLTLLRTSRWYRTPPMRGGSARGFFLNGVALFESRCSPHAFMRYCVELEAAAGRRRSKHWGDRTLDLDILLAGDWILDDPALTLPHPGIADRPFVLIPLLEAWPDATDPRTERKWSEFLIPPMRRPVAIGVVAAQRRALYLDVSTHPPSWRGSIHEDLYRHRQYRPDSRSAQLGHSRWLHDQSLAHRP